MIDNKVLQKISELILLRNKNYPQYIKSFNILKDVYLRLQKLQNLEKEFNVKIGFSVNTIKAIIPFLKENNIKHEDFEDLLVEIATEFRQYLSFGEDEDVPKSYSKHFGEEQPINGMYIHNQTTKRVKDLYTSGNTGIFENFHANMNINDIMKLKKLLSCFHELEIEKLECILPGEKSLYDFHQYLKTEVDELYNKSKYRQDDYKPKVNWEETFGDEVDKVKGPAKLRNKQGQLLAHTRNLSKEPESKPISTIPGNIHSTHIPLTVGDQEVRSNRFLLKW